MLSHRAARRPGAKPRWPPAALALGSRQQHRLHSVDRRGGAWGWEQSRQPHMLRRLSLAQSTWHQRLRSCAVTCPAAEQPTPHHPPGAYAAAPALRRGQPRLAQLVLRRPPRACAHARRLAPPAFRRRRPGLGLDLEFGIGADAGRVTRCLDWAG